VSADGVAGSFDGVRFDGLTMRVLQHAHRAARRAGAVTVGTDDLLIGLCTIPEYVRAYGPPVRAATIDAWRRSVRYDHATADDGGPPVAAEPGLDYEVEGALRETEWRLRRRSPLARRRQDPVWTAGVRAALADALSQAHEAGMPYTNGLQLQVGLIRDPRHRAARVLLADAQDPQTRMRTTLLRTRMAVPGAPSPLDLPPLLPMLTVPGASPPWYGRTTRRVVRAVRRHLLPDAVPSVMLGQQRRHAVRLGQQTVSPHHLLIAMLETDRVLTALGWSLRSEFAHHNTAARLLREAGVHTSALVADALRPEPDAPGPGSDATAGDQPGPAPQQRRRPPGDPVPGRTVTAVYRRAKLVSQRQRHPDVGTTHVLASLLEDPGGETAALLSRLGRDPADVADQVWRDLGVRSAG